MRCRGEPRRQSKPIEWRWPVMSELPLLVFDVNETLLDIEALAPQFQRIYGDAGFLREWFAQLILYSQAITLTGNYVPFGELAGAVARMVAQVRGVQIDEGDIERLQQAVASLPPHPEVPSALGRLCDAGFRLFTLTNNPQSTCKKQLDHAGLSQWFERGFSVDDGVSHYKPAPQVYRAVQESLGCRTRSAMADCLPHMGHFGCVGRRLENCIDSANGKCTPCCGWSTRYLGK
jgi:2-haloacid dehalogenase